MYVWSDKVSFCWCLSYLTVQTRTFADFIVFLFVDPLGYRAWKNLLGYTGVLQGVSGISWSSQSGFLIVFAKKSKTGAWIFWAPFLPKDEQNNCQWEEILRMSCFIVLTTILLSYKENGPWSSRISRLWSINISGKTTFHVELVLKYSGLDR